MSATKLYSLNVLFSDV